MHGVGVAYQCAEAIKVEIETGGYVGVAARGLAVGGQSAVFPLPSEMGGVIVKGVSHGLKISIVALLTVEVNGGPLGCRFVGGGCGVRVKERDEPLLHVKVDVGGRAVGEGCADGSGKLGLEGELGTLVAVGALFLVERYVCHFGGDDAELLLGHFKQCRHVDLVEGAEVGEVVAVHLRLGEGLVIDAHRVNVDIARVEDGERVVIEAKARRVGGRKLEAASRVRARVDRAGSKLPCDLAVKDNVLLVRCGNVEQAPRGLLPNGGGIGARVGYLTAVEGGLYAVRHVVVNALGGVIVGVGVEVAVVGKARAVMGLEL